MKNQTNQIPMCCNCKKAKSISKTKYVLCPLHGVVSYDYWCKKYEFNILKIKPRRKVLNIDDFTEEDFKIS